MSNSTLQGFDYRAGVQATRPRADWCRDMAQTVDAGGRRRVKDGETFVHGSDGRIVFEVYARLPAQRKRG